MDRSDTDCCCCCGSLVRGSLCSSFSAIANPKSNIKPAQVSIYKNVSYVEFHNCIFSCISGAGFTPGGSYDILLIRLSDTVTTRV